jgi:DNA-binding Lrp family transcriptional regulator
MKLDKIDYQIIDMLQHDGRMTIRDMAQKLNLSTTPIFNRIKKLEQDGVIEKYIALINPKKVDKGLFAFVHLSINEHSKEAVDSIVEQVTGFKEVMECHYVTGGADFVLKVLVKNMEEYNSFVTDKLFTVKSIGKIDSLLSLSMPKHSSRIPLDFEDL